MKKISLFLILLFGFYQNSFADTFNFNGNSENLIGEERHLIGDINLSVKSNMTFDLECWDNDINGEIRFYLEGTNFFYDCKQTKNNDIVQESGIWKNVPVGNYKLYIINTQNKNWNWGFGVLNFTSIEVYEGGPGGSGAISQTFIDLDLSDYEYEPEIISVPYMSGSTMFINYSTQFSNLNKNLYEIKLLIMIIGMFHLMWIFYTIKNDLLGKN